MSISRYRGVEEDGGVFSLDRQSLETRFGMSPEAHHPRVRITESASVLSLGIDSTPASSSMVPDSPEAITWQREAEAHLYAATLRQQLRRLRAERLSRASIALDRPGVFLLSRLARDPEGVMIEGLVENLAEPDGWMALARLYAAGLLSDNGRRVYCTEDGLEFAARLDAELSQLGRQEP